MQSINFILASSSPYRKALLEKLQLTFRCISPDIDESPLPNEPPTQLVKRLAIQKAYTVSETTTSEECIIIASDQVATFNHQILGKPHTKENAIKQLTSFSEQCVSFYTSLCVLNTQTKQTIALVEPFNVYFRKLSASEIINYIDKEQPFNCAGSFKSEGLGISLFKKLDGDDPNTLIGLPLIRLCDCLREMSITVLD
ncbi:Maf family nucleotide pyrophosphatase [Thiotrichales bacterium 19S3-7]|nr:Maf family nucleotide pyrophosphatase [Thiotrichales bacterium 19S3-7]MCF6801877.1 Maf family nucleotide pyrophosphatase [Thiotrichales bacterium 19S3-11]